MIERGSFRKIGFRFLTERVKDISEGAGRVWISLSFDFPAKLFDVMTSLIPPLLDIGGIGIKTASMRGMMACFRIVFLLQPGAHGSFSHAYSTGYLFDLHSLLTEIY